MKMRTGHSSSHQPNGLAPDRSTDAPTHFPTFILPVFLPYFPVHPCPRELQAKAYPSHIKTCEIALQSYNKKQGANYELVDLVESNVIVRNGYWVHYNFTAKSKDDSVPRIFFSEIEHVSRPDDHMVDDTVVRACLILDGVNQVRGCRHCQSYGNVSFFVDHPTRGFRTRIRSRDEERIRSLRPRSRPLKKSSVS